MPHKSNRKCTHCVTMNARIQVIFGSSTSVCLDLTRASWFPPRACVPPSSCKCAETFPAPSVRKSAAEHDVREMVSSASGQDEAATHTCTGHIPIFCHLFTNKPPDCEISSANKRRNMLLLHLNPHEASFVKYGSL